MAGGAALISAACGAIPAAGHPSSQASIESPGQSASTRVQVAVVPITDAAPFFLALRHGFFARQGLSVHYTMTPQSTAAAADLVHGTVDVIAAANYVSFFAAQAHGALNIRVLAANSQCGSDTQAVLVLPGSGIRTPQDLAGKTIAVNISPNIQTLTITRSLQADGVSTARVRYVVIPFANRAAALAAHRVDAVSEVEPFLTSTEVVFGAQPVLQQCTGPTAAIPLGGYLTTAAWSQAHPSTARAFQRAIEQGQALAATDRAAVEQILPTYMHISKTITALVNLNTFPVSLNAVQVQRVANLMKEGGMISRPLNVSPLIFR
jgi:NitT/TauT family transport system substrate-binding protein